MTKLRMDYDGYVRAMPPLLIWLAMVSAIDLGLDIAHALEISKAGLSGV
jgi:hypothetical protein